MLSLEQLEQNSAELLDTQRAGTEDNEQGLSIQVAHTFSLKFSAEVEGRNKIEVNNSYFSDIY